MGPFRNNIPSYIFFIIINNNSAGDIFSFHFLFVFEKICKSSVMNQIHCLYSDLSSFLVVSAVSKSGGLFFSWRIGYVIHIPRQYFWVSL